MFVYILANEYEFDPSTNTNICLSSRLSIDFETET